MLHYWWEDMVRFMRDASEYGTYNQELARRLAPALNPQMRVCDAGCGLGYLSLALSPYVGQVTSVEQNPDAVTVLRNNCETRGITNIIPRCGTVQDVIPETPYDAMVFCFFGGIDEILETVRRQCRGKVFIITRNYTTHRFSVGKHATGSYGYLTASRKLTELNIPYTEELFSLEFGQPLRNLEDARRFYEIYSKDEDKTVITDEFLRSKVVDNDDAIFPLYLPHRRNLALLTFDTADLPEEV